MKPLLILLGVFGCTLVYMKVVQPVIDLPLAGRIALSIMLLFTASGHFFFTGGMAKMIPDYVPSRKSLMIISGVAEVLAAIALFFPAWAAITGWLLIFFFVVSLPANIYASLHRINYQTEKADGPGLSYLWFRVPFQILLILWTYFAAISPF